VAFPDGSGGSHRVAQNHLWRLVWEGAHATAGGFEWDVLDGEGRLLSNGIYVAHFEFMAGGVIQERIVKVLVLK
jgi:hypothetical protein